LDPDSRQRTIVEVLAAFAVATAAASGLYHAQAVGFIHRNLHALVALIFLALPQILLRKRGNIERYGFTTAPLGLGLAIAGVAIVMVLPLFSAGFVALLRAGCAWAPAWVPGACARIFHPHWRLPGDFWLQVPAQLIVIALPEELFFRGYVQGRLEEALPPTFELWGARLGWAWLLSAALFALGHYFVTFEPQMLTRFFPGLVFGWMYARTRSILPSAIFHAACNLLMAVLAASLLS
jgi:membrane protease YdiL (CAAX protease family)